MNEYDLVIRGGTIVDGTGIPRYKADLAIRNERVAKISGRIPAGGAREIDAGGCIVAPGIVDLHTHYDAQLNWDPYCSLSGWFGVTSLTIGECGFGFAPTRPEDRDLNMRMMNRIEAIPLDSMRKGMRWDWETFPEYLDSLDRQGLGVNVGAKFPFSPMRAYLLGMMEARERTWVTDSELDQMKQLLREAMEAGAFGVTFNYNKEDRPEDGSFLPSQVASDREFLALADVLAEFGVGHIGQAIGFGITPEEIKRWEDLLPEMTRISGRPCHVAPGTNDTSWIFRAREEGLPIVPQAISQMLRSQFKLAEYNMYDYMPNWIDPLVGTPQERIAKLKAPGVREAMRRDVLEWPMRRTEWDKVNILQTAHERNYKYDGKSIQEVAEIMGKEPLDAFLDLALDEDLETEFELPANLTEEALNAQAARITNPFSHVSNSDGGAHTRYSAGSSWPMWFLSFWVRDREIMSLEQAHHKISAYPAWFTDFRDRGTLRVGNWADVIVYKQDELGFMYDKPVYANDFPGGEHRLIQKPTGLRYTIVNGAVTFEGSDCTGVLPGKLLRSYDMVD